MATAVEHQGTLASNHTAFEGLTEAQMQKVITYDAMVVLKAELERLHDENKVLKRKLADQRNTIRVANEKEVDEKKSTSKATASSPAKKEKEKEAASDDEKKAKKAKKDKEEKKPAKKEEKKDKAKDEEDEDKDEKKKKAPPKCRICGNLRKGNDHSKCEEKRKQQKEEKEKSKSKEDGSESS